ncbi:MAG: hypothetical protein GTO41_14585 [Burkholderiales bacterium]|nr:hypothetical protein [Burkholderiales bacterium]
MNDSTASGTKPPPESLVTTAHVVYGLHALSVLIGATSIATIVGAFVFGIPSIIAVIINYATQSDAYGTFLESHFRWQIRTFWFAVLWSLISLLLIFTIVGIPFAWLLIVGIGLWVVYRIARGWFALANRKPLVFDSL